MKQFSMIFAATLFPIAAVAQDATAKFVSTDGAEIGSANLTATAAGVLIKAEIGELPPDSWVAFHIHETGTCDPATEHDSAGGISIRPGLSTAIFLKPAPMTVTCPISASMQPVLRG